MCFELKFTNNAMNFDWNQNLSARWNSARKKLGKFNNFNLREIDIMRHWAIRWSRESSRIKSSLHNGERMEKCVSRIIRAGTISFILSFVGFINYIMANSITLPVLGIISLESSHAKSQNHYSRIRIKMTNIIGNLRIYCIFYDPTTHGSNAPIKYSIRKS